MENKQLNHNHIPPRSGSVCGIISSLGPVDKSILNGFVNARFTLAAIIDFSNE